MSIYIRNSLIKKRKVEKASNAMRFDAQTLFCSDLDDPREVWKNSEAVVIDAEAASCDASRRCHIGEDGPRCHGRRSLRPRASNLERSD